MAERNIAVPFMDLRSQVAEIREEVLDAVNSVIDSCQFSSGDVVEQFEDEFASWCAARYCIGCASGTAALELILQAIGVGSGDEVLVPANTFVAAAEAVCRVGGTPVFIDVNEMTANAGVGEIEGALGEKTKAVIATHLFGFPVDVGPILDVARHRGIFVIEDCAQAHGSCIHGIRIGSIGDAGAFSFYPSKSLGAFGEAGCVTTSDVRIADRVRLLRDHGADRKNHHVAVGSNARMDSIQAAILRVGLRKLEGWNRRRINVVARYRVSLQGLRDVSFFDQIEGSEPVNQLLVIRAAQRDSLRSYLMERGVGTGVHYPTPLHLEPAYEKDRSSRSNLPVAEKLAGEILSLPLFPHIDKEKVEFVCEVISEWQRDLEKRV